MQIKWLNRAKRALDNEISFIAQEDIELAQKIYAHIQVQVLMLKEFPELGRSGRIWGTRELVISKYAYIISYRIKDKNLEILTVFHTKRQLPNNW